MTAESEKAWGYAAIAVAQAQGGFVPAAFATARRVLVEVERHFPKLAEALVERRDRAAFKEYLLLAGRDVRTAIHACGQLAILYPADATGIAELLSERDDGR